MILPPNSTVMEAALDAVAAARLAGITVPIQAAMNPDLCPVVLLPWLAWELSADEWRTEWTEAQKRAYLRNLYFIHKHKGTLGAVRRLLDTLGFNLAIVEWWQMTPQGEPYTFEIRITPTDGDYERALALDWQGLLKLAKNVRSHLTKVSMQSVVDGSMFAAAATAYGFHMLIEPAIDAVEADALAVAADSISSLAEGWFITS